MKKGLTPRMQLKRQLESGTPCIIRYQDHVRFENADSSFYRPWILESVGWVDYDDDRCIRIVQERYAEATPSGNARIRSTGISIVKSTIIDVKMLSIKPRENGSYMQPLAHPPIGQTEPQPVSLTRLHPLCKARVARTRRASPVAR